MVKAKRYVVARIFEGEIENGDLVIEEEELPELQDEECLVEALCLSVDPYQRAYAKNYKIGQTMIGYQVAKVIASKWRKYPEGTIIVSHVGWRTHTIINKDTPEVYILPDIGNLPVSLGVGMLGMPGNTAYFGLLDICQPKEGETVAVTAAAGAVGSHVGQIAKIKGCKVIGFTGSEQKADWLRSLGFDHVINYKTTTDLDVALNEAAPNGIDCYFDNVGGEISSKILEHMNLYGRIAVCGAITSYNDQLPKATIVQRSMVFKRLRMRGFIVREFDDRWMEGIQQNLEWIKDGKLQYKETVIHGFENMVDALRSVLNGQNIGKAVVKVGSYLVESHSVGFKHALNKFKNLGN